MVIGEDGQREIDPRVGQIRVVVGAENDFDILEALFLDERLQIIHQF